MEKDVCLVSETGGIRRLLDGRFEAFLPCKLDTQQQHWKSVLNIVHPNNLYS